MSYLLRDSLYDGTAKDDADKQQLVYYQVSVTLHPPSFILYSHAGSRSEASAPGHLVSEIKKSPFLSSAPFPMYVVDPHFFGLFRSILRR